MKKLMIGLFAFAGLRSVNKVNAQKGFSASVKATPQFSFLQNKSDKDNSSYENKKTFNASFGIGGAYNCSITGCTIKLRITLPVRIPVEILLLKIDYIKTKEFPPGKSHPVFRDVSVEAGIKEDGYGLGVVVTDVDNDNWPDIYVANDYLANDLLWLNNRNGTFTNIIGISLKHQSYNSMGVGSADINNDGRPELAVLDMSPETNERKKMVFSPSSQEKYDMEM
ncbi:MAG: VCBS repeat-containing protein [Bacteroidota bacterium]|nr:VCBS repeat-containing protein [Bacteroidota bacterium]